MQQQLPGEKTSQPGTSTPQPAETAKIAGGDQNKPAETKEPEKKAEKVDELKLLASQDSHMYFKKEMKESKLRTQMQREKQRVLAEFNKKIGRSAATVVDQVAVAQQVADNQAAKSEGNEEEEADVLLKAGKKKVFDPFSCPPDLDMAETHLKASRIALEEVKPNSSITRLLGLEDEATKVKLRRLEAQTFKVEPSEEYWDKNCLKFNFLSDLERQSAGSQNKQDKVPEAELNEICPCCNNLVKTKFVDFTDGIEGIKNLGVGFSLYFKFNYELMITIFLVALVAIYMTVRNTLGTMCVLDAKSYDGSSTIPPCAAGWITKVSISNYGLTKQDTVEKGLYFLMAIILYFFSIFWYASLHDQAEEMDELQDAPEDWTVLIKNIDVPHTQTMYIDKNLHLEIPELDDYVRLLIENLDRDFKEYKEPTSESKSTSKVMPNPNSNVAPVATEGVNKSASQNPEDERLIKDAEKRAALEAEKVSDEAALESTTQSSSSKGKFKVEATNYVYKCKELVELDKKLTAAKQDLRRMLMSEAANLDDKTYEDFFPKLNPKKNKDPAYNLGGEHFDTSGFSMDFQVKFIQAQFLNTKVLELIKEMKDARRRYYLGWVFVTFQTELMRDEFIAQFENHLKKEKPTGWTAPVKRLWAAITCSTEKGIEITRAPNPEDVIWENLGTSRKERGKHVAISYGVTILVLGMNFGLTLLFNWLKFNYSESLGTTLAVGFSALLAIFNNIFDQILTITINFFTEWENHETKTELKNSILIKIFISQFVNTNLLTLISYVIIFGSKAQGIHVEGGLLSDVVSIIISQLLVNPLLVLVNPPYIIGWLKQYFMQLRVHYSLATSVTQQNAHDTFQYPEIGVAEMYSESLKPLMTAFFFLPMMPAGVLAAVGAAFMVQYANLFRLLRTSATPEPAGSEVAFTSLYLMNMAPLALAVGQLLFESIFRGEAVGGNSAFAWAFFGVTLFLSIVPVYTFFKDSPWSKKMYKPVIEFFNQINKVLTCKCAKKQKPTESSGKQPEELKQKEPESEMAKDKSKNYLNFYNVLKTDYKSQNPVTEFEGVKAREQFEELIKFINDYKNSITELLEKPLKDIPNSEMAGKFALQFDSTERVRVIRELYGTLIRQQERLKYTEPLYDIQNSKFQLDSNKAWISAINKFLPPDQQKRPVAAKPTGGKGNKPETKPEAQRQPQTDTVPAIDAALEEDDPFGGIGAAQNQNPTKGPKVDRRKDHEKALGKAILPLHIQLKRDPDANDPQLIKERTTAITNFFKALQEYIKIESTMTKDNDKKPKPDDKPSTQTPADIKKESDGMKKDSEARTHRLWESFLLCRQGATRKKNNSKQKGMQAIQALQNSKKMQKLASKITYTTFKELLQKFDQKVLEDTFGSKLSKFHYNQTALAENTQQTIAINEQEIMKKMFS